MGFVWSSGLSWVLPVLLGSCVLGCFACLGAWGAFGWVLVKLRTAQTSMRGPVGNCASPSGAFQHAIALLGGNKVQMEMLFALDEWWRARWRLREVGEVCICP